MVLNSFAGIVGPLFKQVLGGAGASSQPANIKRTDAEQKPATALEQVNPAVITPPEQLRATANSISQAITPEIIQNPEAPLAINQQKTSPGFQVTISQVGNDVVWSGSGSFNLAALTSAGPGSVGGGYNSGLAVWAIGPNTSVDTYSGTITYPASFGTSNVAVTSNTGSTFGILPGGSGRLLYVPSGYVSNTNISGTSTYANTTIAGVGLTPGTYTWSWGSGANTSTLVMTIS